MILHFPSHSMVLHIILQAVCNQCLLSNSNINPIQVLITLIKEPHQLEVLGVSQPQLLLQKKKNRKKKNQKLNNTQIPILPKRNVQWSQTQVVQMMSHQLTSQKQENQKANKIHQRKKRKRKNQNQSQLLTCSIWVVVPLQNLKNKNKDLLSIS